MSKRIYTFLLAALLFVGTAALANAADVTVNWTYDSADEANINGYRIYYGTTSQAGVTDPADQTTPAPYDSRIELADPTARSHTFTINDTGTYFFRMTTFDATDDSPFNSTEVSANLGLVAPGGVSVSVTLTFP